MRSLVYLLILAPWLRLISTVNAISVSPAKLVKRQQGKSDVAGAYHLRQTSSKEILRRATRTRPKRQDASTIPTPTFYLKSANGKYFQYADGGPVSRVVLAEAGTFSGSQYKLAADGTLQDTSIPFRAFTYTKGVSSAGILLQTSDTNAASSVYKFLSCSLDGGINGGTLNCVTQESTKPVLFCLYAASVVQFSTGTVCGGTSTRITITASTT